MSNGETVVTMDQLQRMVTYLADNESEGSFRYLIYDVMGFNTSNYCDLYSTGLMNFIDYIHELRRSK